MAGGKPVNNFGRSDGPRLGSQTDVCLPPPSRKKPHTCSCGGTLEQDFSKSVIIPVHSSLPLTCRQRGGRKEKRGGKERKPMATAQIGFWEGTTPSLSRMLAGTMSGTSYLNTVAFLFLSSKVSVSCKYAPHLTLSSFRPAVD